MTKHVTIRKTRDKTRKNPRRFERVNTHQGTAAGEGSRGERGRRRRRRRRRYRAWYLRRLAMWQSRKSITACRSRPRRQRARASPHPSPPTRARVRVGTGRRKPGRGRACDSNTRRAQGSVRRRLHRSALFKQKGESGLDPHERLDAVVDGHAEHLRWLREGDVGHCVDAIYEEVENSRQILP